MVQNKTQPVAGNPAAFIAAIEDSTRRANCKILSALRTRVSTHQSVTRSRAIIGFGTHDYAPAGGRTGEICAIGFAARKGEISLYGVIGKAVNPALLTRLGKHKRGKGSMYARQLNNIDLAMLETPLVDAFHRAYVDTTSTCA